MAKNKKIKKSTFISIFFFIVIGLLILISFNQSDGVRASAAVENIWAGMKCFTTDWEPYCCTRGERGVRGYKRVGAGNNCQKKHLENLEPPFSCTKGVCKKIIACEAQRDALRKCKRELSPSKPLDQRRPGLLKRLGNAGGAFLDEFLKDSDDDLGSDADLGSDDDFDSDYDFDSADDF